MARPEGVQPAVRLMPVGFWRADALEVVQL